MQAVKKTSHYGAMLTTGPKYPDVSRMDTAADDLIVAEELTVLILDVDYSYVMTVGKSRDTIRWNFVPAWVDRLPMRTMTLISREVQRISKVIGRIVFRQTGFLLLWI